MWEQNAKYVEMIYSTYVNWNERFYICPECGEPVYEDDWNENDFCDFLCPICELTEKEAEEEEEF